ncbi:MAG: hypothetical protein RL490_2076 [Pseudomonadota bacterium]|jgi:hypothetical protein
MTGQAQPGRGRSAILLLSCVALLPATVILHELAHWLVGQLAGFPTQLHFASVDGLPETAPFGGAPLGVALAALAGPAMSVLLVGVGMISRHRPWGLPLVATAIARFAVNIIYMIQQAFVLAGVAKASQPNFDEILAARALGLPPQPLAAIGAIVLLAALAWLWRQASGRTLLVLAVGTVAGMVGWLGLLGPRLLP